MKKQSGFTLIELMVVMAIIAILATAGLSAYTGYIKKARDTTRIADLSAINTIVLWQLSVAWRPPLTATILGAAIKSANNNAAIVDPIDGKTSCLTGALNTTTTWTCEYQYKVCDSLSGYAIGAWFESTSNHGLYGNDGVWAQGVNTMYEVGTCATTCTGATDTSGEACYNDATTEPDWSYTDIPKS